MQAYKVCGRRILRRPTDKSRIPIELDRKQHQSKTVDLFWQYSNVMILLRKDLSQENLTVTETLSWKMFISTATYEIVRWVIITHGRAIQHGSVRVVLAKDQNKAWFDHRPSSRGCVLRKVWEGFQQSARSPLSPRLWEKNGRKINLTKAGKGICGEPIETLFGLCTRKMSRDSDHTPPWR